MTEPDPLGIRGQASAEYLGVMAVATLLVAALLALGLPARVAEGLATAACRVTATPRCGPGVERMAPAESDTARREQRDVVLHHVDSPLDDFVEYRRSPTRDPRLDWTSDGCSAPLVGGRGRSFDFTRACLRHDFGYRNTKRLGVFPADKGRIDARFLADMRDHCRTRAPPLQPSCFRWAHTFHHAVRRFG